MNDNGTSASNGGIVIQPAGSGSARVVLNRVQVTNNSAGIIANGAGNTGGIRLTVRDSTVSGNANTGILATSVGGGLIVATVAYSAVLDNGTNAVQANGNAAFFVTHTSITNNNTGLATANGGQIISYTTNNIRGNLTTGAFTSTTPPE